MYYIFNVLRVYIIHYMQFLCVTKITHNHQILEHFLPSPPLTFYHETFQRPGGKLVWWISTIPWLNSVILFHFYFSKSNKNEVF